MYMILLTSVNASAYCGTKFDVFTVVKIQVIIWVVMPHIVAVGYQT